jgi:hypothetical protein
MKFESPPLRSWRRDGLRWAVMPGSAALLLMAIWVHQGRDEPLEGFYGYHASCQEAVAALPTEVGGWIGRDIAIPQPALDLLDANALRHIRFTDFSTQSLAAGPERRVSLLVVQSRLARDMQGHYPPRCYPAQGARLLSSEPRRWLLRDEQGELAVSGMEYQFLEPDRSGTRDLPAGLLAAEGYTLGRRRVVLSFLIVPGQGPVGDMKALNDAAEDYRRRHRGAAQVQVVFDPSWALPDRAERDAIAAELLGAALGTIRVLADVEAQSPAGPVARP